MESTAHISTSVPDGIAERKDVFVLLEWNYVHARGYRQRMLNCIFRHWHRALLLELEVVHLKFGAEIATAKQLQRLNFWIGAYGAWRASALPYWDGFNLLTDVLSGNLGENFRVGTAGGGRAYRYISRKITAIPHAKLNALRKSRRAKAA